MTTVSSQYGTVTGGQLSPEDVAASASAKRAWSLKQDQKERPWVYRERKEFFRDFRLALVAVEDAVMNGTCDEEQVLKLAQNYGREFEMTAESAKAMLDISLREILQRFTGE